MQEECLSEEKEAGMEDKTVTSKEWFGEDYGVVLKNVEQNSSEESFVEKIKKKKRIIRDSGLKLKNCRCRENVMKNIGRKKTEEDKSIRREQRKHSGIIVKTPGLIATSQNKKRSEKGKSKGRVKLIISLYILSSLFVMSVLYVCYPQCCDYYREYQIVTYTGGTRPT